MKNCPSCGNDLIKIVNDRGIHWHCSTCKGNVASISFLRKNLPAEIVNNIWSKAKTLLIASNKVCPSCGRNMVELSSQTTKGNQILDACKRCQIIWFDEGEYEKYQQLPANLTIDDQLSTKSKQQFALVEVEGAREIYDMEDNLRAQPEEGWKIIPAILGLPVERDKTLVNNFPFATVMISIVILIFSVLAFTDLKLFAYDFGLIPKYPFKMLGLNFLTNFFIHGGYFHLLSNLYFLFVFGDDVEDNIGKYPFVLLLFLATLFGNILHVLFDPNDTIPAIGASGGISGVLVFYALKWPKTPLSFIIRIYYRFKWIKVPAILMFGLWLIIQIIGFSKQITGYSSTSYLAHIGGVIVGFIFWLFYNVKEDENLKQVML